MDNCSNFCNEKIIIFFPKINILLIFPPVGNSQFQNVFLHFAFYFEIIDGPSSYLKYHKNVINCQEKHSEIVKEKYFNKNHGWLVLKRYHGSTHD